MLFVPQALWNGEFDSEPMGGPTGAKGLSKLCWNEFILDSIREGGSCEVRGRIDGEFYMLVVINYSLEEFTAGDNCR